ncbi:hypothetical protein D0Z03_000899 [Geotrichum reessii]|nr:hypothetical protein D0Z03_000899 [Galactomyces reessii]
MSFTRQEPHYFGAGPALLPTDIVAQAAADFVNYNNIGLGLGEISHRSSDAIKIIDDTKANLIKILDIPDTHEVLFMQGGGTGGFAAIPYNLLAAFATKTGKKGKADYFVTGDWSSKAAKEAERLGFEVNYVVDSKKANNGKFGVIPDKSQWKFSNPEDTAYVYYCDNETVAGVEFPYIPEVPEGVELVVDMSSNILSRKVDVSKFGLIFGGAQKNIGIAGVSFYIVKKSLYENKISEKELVALNIPLAPIVLDFATVAKNNSTYNTLPIFGVHVINLCLVKMLANGGLSKQQEISERKAEILYKTLDKYPQVFNMTVEKSVRSKMNIVFTLKEEDAFLKQAAAKGLTGLKGHRSVGGIRISNYNAVSEESVQLLVEFIENFAATQQ